MANINNFLFQFGNGEKQNIAVLLLKENISPEFGFYYGKIDGKLRGISYEEIEKKSLIGLIIGVDAAIQLMIKNDVNCVKNISSKMDFLKLGCEVIKKELNELKKENQILQSNNRGDLKRLDELENKTAKIVSDEVEKAIAPVSLQLKETDKRLICANKELDKVKKEKADCNKVISEQEKRIKKLLRPNSNDAELKLNKKGDLFEINVPLTDGNCSFKFSKSLTTKKDIEILHKTLDIASLSIH